MANLALGAAWFARDTLVAHGWLAGPPLVRVDLPSQPLPALAPPRVSATSQPGDEVSPPEAQDTPPVAIPAPVCVGLGPFVSLAEAAEVARRIESTGGEAQVLERSEVGAPDYFVYVEPAPSRALAHRTWQELVAQGIDAFVIPRGERENGVSVGVFTRRELAVAQRDRVSELGFDVAMRTVRRSHTVYLLETRSAPAQAIAGLVQGPCGRP